MQRSLKYFYFTIFSWVLSAQSPWLLTSDPVGIARSGAQVSYGRSLEASTFNPALLTTLQDSRSVFISLGLEMQSTQQTLQSNQTTLYSSDRNRSIPAFGLAWKLNPSWSLGLHSENTFSRHLDFGSGSFGRFFGDRLSLVARLTLAQVAFSPSAYPEFSVGIGIGMLNTDYVGGLSLRSVIPSNPNAPVSTSNPSLGVFEQRLVQSGSISSPVFQVGGRWAINSRWSMGFAYQSGTKESPSLSSKTAGTPLYYSNNGFGNPLVGGTTSGATLIANTTSRPGTGMLELPSRLTWGIRFRPNTTFTMELDIRRMSGNFSIPDWPSLVNVTGTISSPSVLSFAPSANSLRSGRPSMGLSLGADITLNQSWTLRTGFSQDQSTLSDAYVNPILGGAASSTFSAGFSYIGLGGEWSLGYQIRQSRDIESKTLDGSWNSGGFSPTGTPVGVEGMGHVIAIGYKTRF